ncbi:hypothetical protein Bca52824_006644 [Brassica carinata]|uniref:Ribosomal protein eL8/eL30/eS12/Gadd45 domain-containing protein n=1 Tax=Brassica carinata TaxID=52824 RepID=A0A8X7W5G1_BRACI|nr:hypothetical protein Bca52824_006644 [Brassica carinata]
MSGDEAAPVVVPPVAEPAAIIPEDMDLLLRSAVAQLCVLAEDCNQPDYVKLVKALCADHNINLLTVPSAKTLGEWAGDYGEDTTALNIVKKHIESN